LNKGGGRKSCLFAKLLFMRKGEKKEATGASPKTRQMFLSWKEMEKKEGIGIRDEVKVKGIDQRRGEKIISPCLRERIGRILILAERKRKGNVQKKITGGRQPPFPRQGGRGPIADAQFLITFAAAGQKKGGKKFFTGARK